MIKGAQINNMPRSRKYRQMAGYATLHPPYNLIFGGIPY